MTDPLAAAAYIGPTYSFIPDHITSYLLIGSCAASFKRPLLPVDVFVCLSVCLFVLNFDAKYLETSCPIWSLQESAYSASIDDVVDYVT